MASRDKPDRRRRPCIRCNRRAQTRRGATTNCFAKRPDFPRFKKKSRSDSFCCFAARENRLDQASQPSVAAGASGGLRYRNCREALGAVQNITVSQSHGKWFVRTQTERAAELPIPQGGAVGINIGIARSVTLSDGTSYAPLGSFRQQHADYLRQPEEGARLRRAHSGLASRTPAAPFCLTSRHHISTAIGQTQAIVWIEAVQVRSRSESAAGRTERATCAVTAGLNKAIRAQGRRAFRRFCTAAGAADTEAAGLVFSGKFRASSAALR